MKDEQLTHRNLFGETPQIFSMRITHTLTDLKGEKKMKKSIGGILIIAIVLMVLCAAALAAVGGFGLDWLFKDMYSNHPLPENVVKLIQNDIVQTADHPLLDLKVESTIFMPEGLDTEFPKDHLLEFLVSIQPKDPAKYEVHSWDNMNTDGYRDERNEDYITTQKGTGPIRDMMQDPEKSLLLYGGRAVISLYAGNHSMGLAPIEWYCYDPNGVLIYYCVCPITDKELNAMKAVYADADHTITLHYTDISRQWNIDKGTVSNMQNASITFTVKLPD
jgi:hypothetical protein